jgi:ferric-dicitrate binding protein FerR (iron transport regulator)
MQEQELKDLLARIHDGTATDNEKAFIENWYLQYREAGNTDYTLEERLEDAGAIWSGLQPVQTKPAPKKLWPRIAAAASILLVLSSGAYFMLHERREPADDVSPYSAFAVLKSGGRMILLDDTKNGKIAQTVVTKSPGEQLMYVPNGNPHTSVYDTLQIPAGGRPYTVVLSDGSRITVNVATSLRYPEVFSKNRKEQVELISGEIYAEVVHNTAAPLQIKTPGQVITDIGTAFDVSAYTDEADVRTTLIEGAIRVNAAGQEKNLAPGHQSILNAKSLIEQVADVAQVTAWKDGLFRFNGERIEVIMRQLIRWYNIEVVYEGKVTDEVFYGRVNRKRNLGEVLRILERSKKVHFKVEGRRVTVLSK